MAKVSVIDYTHAEFEEKAIKDIEECFAYKNKDSVTWIDVDGIEDTELIAKITKHYDIHPLAAENILEITQRPKTEEFDDQLYLSLKMLSYNNKTQKVESEHISIILSANFVITFQQGKEGDVWSDLRNKLRSGKCKQRKTGTDFLTYSIIHAILDNYFVILEKVGEKIEDIETEVITKPDTHSLRKIYRFKREMMFMRKAVWPVREIINIITRSESGLIKDQTIVYLRDIYEHTIQIIDTIELYRDMLAGMLDIYLSSISNKMNAIMKVLTIISTIFIPLTFVSSIYGMNFEFMPELKWKYGYAFIWAIMISITIAMLIYFRRKKWF